MMTKKIPVNLEFGTKAALRPLQRFKLKCTKCKKKKYPEDFTKDHRKRNGLSSWCKTCHSEAAQAYAKVHPEKFREIQARYKERRNARTFASNISEHK